MTSTHNFCVHAKPTNKTNQLHSSLSPLRLTASAYTISPQPSVSKHSRECFPWGKKIKILNRMKLHFIITLKKKKTANV